MMRENRTHLESVEPTRRIRIVLAARDRRFLRVTSFLLAREGFLVDSTRKLEDLLDMVQRHRPDVVILDGMDSLAKTARAIAGIEAIPYSVAVLVVAEAPEVSSPRSVRLLHKWTSFDRLVHEVERLSGDAPGKGEVSPGLA
jgi:DNA-binding NtrC family response regulator